MTRNNLTFKDAFKVRHVLGKFEERESYSREYKISVFGPLHSSAGIELAKLTVHLGREASATLN